MKSWSILSRALLASCLLTILLISACKRGPLQSGEYLYVAAPQVNLRDRVAPVYNKLGAAQNGDRVEVLERQKRFVRVRTGSGLEGWVEQRYLVPEAVFDQFQKLATENKGTISQGQGVSRAALNMHVTPARDSERLYQLAEGEKVEILKRATAERPNKQAVTVPKPASKVETAANGKKTATPAVARDVPEPPKAYDDFWLVRNQAGRTGWVLARMVDLDVPLDIAQYSEGQRIMAAFVINRLQDEDKQVPQYLVLFSENKDGMPFDYNQARVFTWNTRKDRYETAYRERGIMGFFPVTVGQENFDKEGPLPTFTLRVQTRDGGMGERKYKLNQPIVRRVLAPGEQPQKAAAPPKLEKPKRRPKS